MGRLFDDCNSVATTDYTDCPYRTPHDEDDGILIHDSRNPGDRIEREAMLLPSIQDQLADALLGMIAEQMGGKLCGHADNCVCAIETAKTALRLHNNEKAILTAEREQAIKAFGDPLKTLFTSFNREFGSKK